MAARKASWSDKGALVVRGSTVYIFFSSFCAASRATNNRINTVSFLWYEEYNNKITRISPPLEQAKYTLHNSFRGKFNSQITSLQKLLQIWSAQIFLFPCRASVTYCKKTHWSLAGIVIIQIFHLIDSDDSFIDNLDIKQINFSLFAPVEIKFICSE